VVDEEARQVKDGAEPADDRHDMKRFYPKHAEVSSRLCLGCPPSLGASIGAAYELIESAQASFFLTRFPQSWLLEARKFSSGKRSLDRVKV
jgi:hypothetical protein